MSAIIIFAADRAGIAQLVEQLICNQQVGGSSPSTSSTRQSIEYGGIPEWPKGADCKSVVDDFGGSNPPAPTKNPNAKAFGFLLFTYYLFTFTLNRIRDFGKVIGNSEK